MVARTITHTRIDTLEYGGNKINAIKMEDKIKVTARRKLYSRYKDNSTS